MTQSKNPIPRRNFLAGTGAFLAATALSASSKAQQNKTQSAVPTLRIQRLAWAGLRIDLGDNTLFVDATHTSPQDGLPDAPITTTAKNRFALITHHHSDHYAPDDLRQGIGDQGTVFAHKDVARWMDTRSFRLHTVELHEPVFIPTFESTLIATAIPAVDGFGHPQVSWVIEANGKKIFHGGDTLWHGHWWDIASTHGPFDVVFLPINGFRIPRGRFIKSEISMGLNPEQAASAAWILGAHLAVPMHYGAIGDPTYIEVPNAEERFLKASAGHGVETKVLQPGEWLEL